MASSMCTRTHRASADVAVIDSRTDRLVTLPVGKVPHQVSVSDVVNKLVASNTPPMDDELDHRPADAQDAHAPRPRAGAHGARPKVVCVARGRQHRPPAPSRCSRLEEEREVGRVTGFFEPWQSTFDPDAPLLLRGQSRRQPRPRDRRRRRPRHRRDQDRRATPRPQGSPGRRVSGHHQRDRYAGRAPRLRRARRGRRACRDRPAHARRQEHVPLGVHPWRPTRPPMVAHAGAQQGDARCRWSRPRTWRSSDPARRRRRRSRTWFETRISRISPGGR